MSSSWPAYNDLAKSDSVADFVTEIFRSFGARACICRLRRSAVKKVLEAQVKGAGGAPSGGAACLNFIFVHWTDSDRLTEIQDLTPSDSDRLRLL